MFRGLRRLILGVMLACAPEYAYEPVTTTSAIIEPRGPERARVHVEARGVGKVTPLGETKPVTALHVRTVVTNPTQQSWTFDTREQRVAVEGHGTVAAVEVLGAMMGMPFVLSVEPRRTRTVDLYYPLPKVDRETDLPGSVEVISTVRAENGITTQRTVVNGVGTRRFTPFLFFPFFPFGLSKAWSP